MVKRLLSAVPSEILNYNKNELLEAIRLSEGRTIISEIIATKSLLDKVSNAEVAAAFGADIIILNFFDFDNPKVKNMEGNTAKDIVKNIKEFTGCPLGVNLEPKINDNNSREKIEKGRQASLKNMKEAVNTGFDIICFTGNPSTGVSNSSLIKAVKKANNNLGDEIIIIAGKMHMAGVQESYTNTKYITDLIGAGVDIVLLPAPGTVPGIDSESLKESVKLIHKNKKLFLTAIGTSQESSETQTIREIALKSKQLGADLHHIGDAAYGGIALPENILTLSKTIRGRRHTYKKMALSIKR